MPEAVVALGEIVLQHEVQRRAADKRDQAHDERRVDAMPDGETVFRRALAEHRQNGRVQERADGQARDDADDEAGEHEGQEAMNRLHCNIGTWAPTREFPCKQKKPAPFAAGGMTIIAAFPILP